MTLINCLEGELNKTTYTENGALSYKSTLDPVLDFFSKSGALRGKHEEAYSLFEKAMTANKVLAKRALFYMRDVRKGQGERELFRYIVNKLALNNQNELCELIVYIPEFGRWDDLYSFVGTRLEEPAFELMRKQFEEDISKVEDPKGISLLGKWLKSINTSSKETRKLGEVTRKHFKLSPKEYRQKLALLRTKINVVECKMTEKKWGDIEYSKVSSNAMKRYIKAFKKHDEERYAEYLKKVEKGVAKIHSATLYPYDIVNEYRKDENTKNDTLEEMWKHLPNYFEGANQTNAICVVDTSGSMYSGSEPAPIDVALSLGIYIAERNVGRFQNTFITFSGKPTLQKIEGETLQEKIRNISTAEWKMNTNLIKVFELILKATKDYNVPENERIEKLFIISDMQFDSACRNFTTFEVIDKMFNEAGIKRPELIFWNVNARSDSPVEKDKRGAYLVSGASPSILKHALNMKEQTAMDLMLDVLNSERYSMIN